MGCRGTLHLALGTLLGAPCSGHPAPAHPSIHAGLPMSRRQKKTRRQGHLGHFGQGCSPGKAPAAPLLPRQGRRPFGFQGLGAKRATHKRAAGEGWRSLAGGRGRRNLAVAPGSLLVSAATAGTRGPLLLIVMGTVRKAPPAPSQAAARGWGAIPRSSSGDFGGTPGAHLTCARTRDSKLGLK